MRLSARAREDTRGCCVAVAVSAMAAPPGPTFDKSRFLQRLSRLALRIPKHHSHRVASLLAPFLLDLPRVKHIVPDPRDPAMRLLLLSPLITPPGSPSPPLPFPFLPCLTLFVSFPCSFFPFLLSLSRFERSP